ncbi:MAG TPA: radical SAM protein [Candidatus Sulfotelmatobacter sp.]|nr:radical SAM protein [Candidatus Sulfotelmatobacter sp.]
MLVQPLVLSILTTRRCTAACDHCCVGAGPKATDAIPIPRIHALLDEALAVPSIQRIGFSGGETFLLGDDLDDLIRHATSNGFHTRALSNGYWAKDAPTAMARVATLREAGLRELMLSTGTFHQRFVPPARVLHAARAAAEAGILTRVSVETCDQSTVDPNAVREALADLIARKLVFVGADPWITDAGGRGQAALSHEALLAEGAGDAASGPCVQIMNVLTVTPRQELLACCGYPMEELPRLRIASVANLTLAEAIANTPDSLFKMWLHVAGPSGIAEFVARYLPGFTLPPSASICQSCATIQRDARSMAIISAHAAEIARDLATHFQLSLHRNGSRSHRRESP